MYPPFGMPLMKKYTLVTAKMAEARKKTKVLEACCAGTLPSMTPPEPFSFKAL